MSDSITVKSSKRLSYITTNVGVSFPFDVNNISQPPKPYTTAALWDTGSSHCFITKSLATSLALHPTDKALVEHAMGRTFENVYFATLQITEKYYIEIELTECQSINNNFEIIIGMDVINQGNFAITNQEGMTTFSFRLPSETTINFQEK